MTITVQSAVTIGIQASEAVITAEVQPRDRPRIKVIGLSAPAAKEAEIRVTSALHAAGFSLDRAVDLNIAAASAGSEPGLDLPMAVAAAATLDPARLPAFRLENKMIVGALSLSGTLQSIRGMFGIAELAAVRDHARILMPFANLDAASAGANGSALLQPARSFVQVIDDLRADAGVVQTIRVPSPLSARDADFADVPRNARAKKAIECAIIGGGNVLLVGPPGSGRTMIARRIPTVMPHMSETQARTVQRVHSAAGLDLNEAVRPFRAPHTTISVAGLTGGGTPIRPGEVTLAHNGVLFIDDFAELPRVQVEVLRSARRSREVHLARPGSVTSLPADFMLVATAREDEIKSSRFPMDLFDIAIDVESIHTPADPPPSPSERSAAIRARIEAALR